MREITLTGQSASDFTMIQNTFIDQYMPAANGEYVKIYLYLLRALPSGKPISLSVIADTFDHTEKDVKRALLYWTKLNLLQLTYNETGELAGIFFLPLSMETEEPSTKDDLSTQKEIAVTSEPEASAFPSKTNCLTSDKIRSLKGQEEIRQLLYIAEQYLEKTLSPTEVSNILYFYEGLHFSTDLIEYLIEYCVSKGSKSPRYIEKVALSWAKEGITTVAQAKTESNLYHKHYFTILNAFGIKGRGPADAESELMSKWLNDYHFQMDIILEACSRTIMQTHQPNFPYTDKILSDWHEKGIRHKSDIEALNKQHREQKKAAPAPKAKPASNNRFNNFNQREYDYDKLEQQLLNR